MKLSREDWCIIALLVASTLIVFARTARFEFVHYDDPEYVFKNPYVTAGLTVESVKWALTTFEQANWHPMTWLSHMLDIQLFGANPGALHAMNVAFHVANVLVLFLALRTMTGSSWRSGLVAALFALHPLHVESVVWIAERKDVLSTFFALLAMLTYAQYVQAESTHRYLLTIVFFALSLMAKPMFVTLPFLLLLLDYWPLRRDERIPSGRLLVEKLPLLALSAASCVITFIAARAEGALNEVTQIPMKPRLANAITSYVRYIIDMFWPDRLAVLYPFPFVQRLPIILGAAIVLLLITFLVIKAARSRRELLVGWLWYLGTLVPAIGIIAVGEQGRADRYTYFPFIGLFIMLAWSIPQPITAFGRSALATAVAVILLVLSVRTWQQVSVWRNSQTLLENTIAISGPHPSIVLNYAISLSEKGQHAQSIEFYQKALRSRPNWAKAYNNMGNSLARLGQLDQAEVSYRRAIAANPRDALAHYNLGTTLGKQGRLAEAEIALREAVRLRPDYYPARNNLNNALRLQGKPPE